MAEARVGVILETRGSRETSTALNEVGRSADNLSRQSTGLTSSLKKLAGAFLGLIAVRRVLSFLKEAGADAMEQAEAYTRLNSVINRLGLEADETRRRVDDFASSMVSMGRMGTDTYNAVSRLGYITKDIGEAMRLTKLASDLAASGLGDYTRNVEQLERILAGRGQRAITEFGLGLESNATSAEIIRAMMERVTITTEDWSESAIGQMAVQKAEWQDLKEQLGVFSAVTMSNLANSFTQAINRMSGQTYTFGMFMTRWFNFGIPAVFNTFRMALSYMGMAVLHFGNFIMRPFVRLFSKDLAEAMDKVMEKAKANHFSWQKYTQSLIERSKKVKEQFDAIYKGEDTGWMPTLADDTYDNASIQAETAARKIELAFDRIATTIVQTMQRSSDRIKSLRDEIDRLRRTTDEAVDSQEKAYQRDLDNMARRTQGNIDSIQEEMKRVRQTMARGWRERISELEKDMAKENEVMARLQRKGVDIQEQATKDELTLLRERHEERLLEIRDSAKREELALELQALEERTGMLTAATQLLQPGTLDRLAQEEMVRKAWETPTHQQIFNFNFEGDVSDQDALIKLITDHLNRLSELKQFAGE